MIEAHRCERTVEAMGPPAAALWVVETNDGKTRR